MKTSKYLRLFFPTGRRRTREILNINPTIRREEAENVRIYVYEYNSTILNEYELKAAEECGSFKGSPLIKWINIEGIKKANVETICNIFDIHSLISEDILNEDQRPKMDDDARFTYCLMNILHFNERTGVVEQRQISIILGKEFVITFQEQASDNMFAALRNKLTTNIGRIRQNGADYLCYSIIDTIVDHYFVVMERVSDRIEILEEEIIRTGSTRNLAKINSFRKELIVLHRNISPVRDMLNGLRRNENELIDRKTLRYFKDISDHIVQAAEMVDNYREMLINMQDLYLNKVSLRMNESMKVMAVVTCLMAPAMVVGGIFGMNFEHIPLLNDELGFYLAIGIMFIVPLWMIYVFKKRHWF